MMGGEPFDPNLFRSVPNTHGETDHVESTDVSRTVEAPVGVWTDVRAGQRSAEGTVIRPEWPGLLFDAEDPTKVICWHLKPSVFVCNRRNLKPEQVVLEEGTNAPFCPTCLKEKKRLAKNSQVRGDRKKKKIINRLKEQKRFKGKIRYTTALPIEDKGNEN